MDTGISKEFRLNSLMKTIDFGNVCLGTSAVRPDEFARTASRNALPGRRFAEFVRLCQRTADDSQQINCFAMNFIYFKVEFRPILHFLCFSTELRWIF